MPGSTNSSIWPRSGGLRFTGITLHQPASLEWLAKRTGVRVLLADVERLNIAPDGRVLKRESLSARYGLQRPDRRWRWDLAPIPEWSPDFHRVHEVGAWIYG